MCALLLTKLTALVGGKCLLEFISLELIQSQYDSHNNLKYLKIHSHVLYLLWTQKLQ